MLNKAQIIGYLGKDPEIKYLPSGDMVASFTVATNERYKDKTGQLIDKTEWHNVTAFSYLAEIIKKYLKKGSLIYVEGKINTKKWQDSNGNDRYSTGIIAKVMKILPKNDGLKLDGNHKAQENGDKSNVFDDIPF